MLDKKTMYNFVGGKYNKRLFDLLEVMNLPEWNRKLSDDLSLLRSQGILVKRAELDNQPVIPGYLGPMWDGIRYITPGGYKYEFECSEDEKRLCSSFIVLRYETQEVYNALSE